MSELGEIKQIIANNLKTICKEKNVKQIQIAEFLGVQQGSVTKWLNGVNGIDVENLYKLCQYLGITMNTVFGIDENGNDITTGEFSEPELHLVNVYRALNALGRSRLTDYADDLAESERYKKDGVSAKMA